MSLSGAEISRFLEMLHPFRMMDEAQLRLVASLVGVATYAKGESIYKQGDDSRNLYIVFGGKISLLRQDDEEDELWGFYYKGDQFGFEAWREGQPRMFSAIAEVDSQLLYLDTARLYDLAIEIPILRDYLQLMLDSIALGIGLKPEWRDPDEPIHYISRVHQALLYGKLAIPVGISLLVQAPLLYVYFVISANNWLLGACLVVFLCVLGWILWTIEDWANDYFFLTDRRIVSWNRVLMLYENRQEAPLDAVLAVTIRTGSFFARRFSYGDVIARTYTGTIFLDRLAHPEQLASMIEERMTRNREESLCKEKVSRVDMVEQRLGYKPAPTVNGQVVTQTTETSMPESLLDWLSLKFQMRSEEGGALTYRTHWYLLLKRTWLQVILIAGLIMLLATQTTNQLLPFFSGTFILLWLVSLVILFGWWLYGYLDWRHDCYIITADQVVDIDHKPFGREHKRSAALKNIQSVEYKRIGLTGLLLNYGTVYIRIGDQDFTFDNVYDPSEVQRELFNRIQRCKRKEKQAEVENERQRILDWIEAYHQATEGRMDSNRFEQ